MNKIVIFSGTSEGRMISEALCLQQIDHVVCVATDYGRDVMTKSDYAYIHTGRMDEAEIEQLLRAEASLVIDATHPYADVVSKNISAAAQNAGIEYIRVKRGSINFGGEDSIRYIEREDDLSALLSDYEGNILLTTGTKLLSGLELADDVKSRIFVRVIPSVESIQACLAAGIPVKNIIAMQGPFSTEMNEAVIREYEISCMVTKESGAAGGFPEKIEAALATGISVIVIGRPNNEEGLGVAEVINRICPGQKRVQISLIGIGMGSRDCMTFEADNAIKTAQAVFGPERILSEIKHGNKVCHYLAADIVPIIEQNRYSNVAILFSGDSGFYSGAATFKRDIKSLCDEADTNYEIKIIPGISSASYMAAKIGKSYSNAFIHSIHGKSGDSKELGILREGIDTHEDTFVLLSGDEDVRLIGKMLSDNPSKYDIILGKKLSYEDEEIIKLTVNEARGYSNPGLYIGYIHNAEPINNQLIRYLEDDEFVRNDTPMTKEIIRHEIIRLLRIREGDTVLDIGSGTGSVSIEAARLHPSVRVCSVEINPKACECMRNNIAKFGCTNIELIEADAADVIASLPVPNSVFIGGSRGELNEIIDELAQKNKGIRVVITAVTLETLTQILEIKKRYEVNNYKVSQIQVADVKEIGSHNLMNSQNPVFICSFDI